MDFSTITTTLDQQIFTITINRPDKLNALNKMVLDEVDRAMDQVYKEADIKGVIITGSGEKAFVAGADISEFEAIPDENGSTFALRGQQLFFKIENCPKPVIAAVNGFALGGGCELAMACHFRIASSNSRFGQPEVSLGIIPGYGGTQRLAMLVGKGRALELIMTGNMVSAEEAKSWGLVNHVEEPANLLPKSREILNQIITKSPVALAKAIASVNSLYDTRKDGFSEEARLFGEAFSSNDRKEGVQAFLEKRKPVFSGK